ncbi:MAG TPA: alpha/beta hydrolase-fold protein [Chitinophagaceae bacterium]|nr:alpha/beta hydrolase-fold protein [Chitinophagaceae bacterium]
MGSTFGLYACLINKSNYIEIKSVLRINEKEIMETLVKQSLSNNVFIIDAAFYMPQLGRNRRIWLYLPPEYSTSKQHYPVLYMHDGQNLFEDSSAFGEEWGVDESLNALNGKCIVVGIDNGLEKRINEYTVHDGAPYGNGEGNAYLSFVVQTLKPYIDETYRTLEGREHTFIAGSSLGALISFYAMLYYPHVFSAAGIFSPAFWIAPGLLDETKHLAGQNQTMPQRFYFYYGEKEGHEMAANARAIMDVLKAIPQYKVKAVIDPEGTHSEANWRIAFTSYYKWMMQKEKRSR